MKATIKTQNRKHHPQILINEYITFTSTHSFSSPKTAFKVAKQTLKDFQK